ncbi:MAG: hypothetical protein AB4368_23535 [Xenococcaceae cyanobacterium]
MSTITIKPAAKTKQLCYFENELFYRDPKNFIPYTDEIKNILKRLGRL